MIAGGFHNHSRGPAEDSGDMARCSDPPPGERQLPLSWQHVETLGVAEVVMAILDARKTMSWATAASISRERRDDLVYVRVTLLEGLPPSSTGEPKDSPGRGEVAVAFAARRLGMDLSDAFGQKDTIVLR
jgi:hypothetical protein